jgi:anthranilate phosphoribosyltransferase
MNFSNLTNIDFEKIFDDIIDAKISDAEIKKILLALNDANIPSNAFIGAVTSLKKRMKQISAPKNAIDVCGTGGDKLNTLNISTSVCFVVAAAGIPVAKHGNKAISSASGSADVFSELGVKISTEVAEIEKNLREKNLCFLFAPFFHEALKNVAKIRKELAVPTIFNFLGPLLNPANTRHQLIGVSRRDVMRKMASVLQPLAEPVEACLDSEALTRFDKLSDQNLGNRKAYIVHGFDGMDEITLGDNSYLLSVANGKISEEEIIDPRKFGFARVGLEALKGADPKHNAKKLLSLLEGEKSAYRDIVILNSAFAFKLADKVKKIEDGIELAKSMLDSGAAKKVLEKLL